MASNGNETETQTVTVVAPKAQKKAKKMKPARKQVKPGEVEKKETPQTGKEYSSWSCAYFFASVLIVLSKISGTINGLAVTERTATPSAQYPTAVPSATYLFFQQSKIPNEMQHQERLRPDPRQHDWNEVLLPLLLPWMLPIWLGMRIFALSPRPRGRAA